MLKKTSLTKCILDDTLNKYNNKLMNKRIFH